MRRCRRKTVGNAIAQGERVSWDKSAAHALKAGHADLANGDIEDFRDRGGGGRNRRCRSRCVAIAGNRRSQGIAVWGLKRRGGEGDPLWVVLGPSRRAPNIAAAAVHLPNNGKRVMLSVVLNPRNKAPGRFGAT